MGSVGDGFFVNVHWTIYASEVPFPVHRVAFLQTGFGGERDVHLVYESKYSSIECLALRSTKLDQDQCISTRFHLVPIK